MSKITKLSAQKKDKNRVNIEIDGEFSLGLSLEEVVKNHLKVGMDVDDQSLSSWKDQEERDKVLGKAINFLSYRPRTTSELNQRLNLYTHNQEIKCYVLNYLTSHSLLDDLAFAKWWARARGLTHSTRAITYELRVKGIASNIINQVIKNESGDELSLERFMRKKFTSQCLTDPKAKARLIRNAISRGYSYALVKEAFQKLADEC